MAFRPRVQELRWVPASALRANPRNWRKHPTSQRRALTAALTEIGIADAVIARETPDGLELIDGHLRADVLGDQAVPVLVVDVDETEALKLLATLDPLSAMAGRDDDALRSVVEQVDFAEAGLRDALGDLLAVQSDFSLLEGAVGGESLAEQIKAETGLEEVTFAFGKDDAALVKAAVKTDGKPAFTRRIVDLARGLGEEAA